MLKIDLRATPYLSLALYGNDVPPVRGITLTVPEAGTYTVTLASLPAVIETTEWAELRLESDQSRELPVTHLRLNYKLLSGLNETLPARITIEVRRLGDPEQKTTVHADVRLLPPSHWGGYSAVPELLAAHVLPNDPAVPELMRRAAELLREQGYSLNEYQSESTKSAAAQFIAAMTAIQERNLLYASVPASFEDYGQKIRTPTDILKSGLGNCLDLSCLGAAVLEQIGLHPIIIAIEGHAYLACWLQPSPVSTGVLEDPQDLRKPFRSQLLLACEMTALVSGDDNVNYAILKGGEQILDPNKFIVGVDLHAARRGEGIKPLNQVIQKGFERTVSGGAGREKGSLNLNALDSFGVGTLGEQAPTEEVRTGSARIDQWKSKLLNLTRRNRLLNYRLTKGAIHLRYVSGSDLEDYLASGKQVRFDTVDNERSKHHDVSRALVGDHYRDIIGQEVERGKLLVIDTPESLTRNLLTLDRAARLALEEGGANVLFVAIGFAVRPQPGKAAEFRPGAKAADRPEYAAPLILLPVNLSRRSAASAYRIMLRDDEPLLNPTFLEYLKRELQIDLSEYAYELPTDESGLDVNHILGRIRAALLNVAGWEVTEDVTLGLFNFKKYLMWRDLHNFEEELKKNPVVAHLIDTPREPFYDPTDPAAVPFPAADRLDETFPAAEMLTPMSADSSQLAAVRAAAQGIDFILEGPPGTGKSQTITNMIAQLLGEGKKVLFVSEKKAALDVVERRLDGIGLGEFCLELHANNATKSAVYGQLQKALEMAPAGAHHFDQAAENLERVRGELNETVAAIHAEAPLGLSAFSATSFTARHPTTPAPAPAPETIRTADREWLTTARHLIRQMAIYYADVSPRARGALQVITGPVETAELVAAAQQMVAAATEFLTAGKDFSAALKLATPSGDERKPATALNDLATLLLAAEHEDYTDLADMIDSGRARRSVAIETEATFALAAAFSALNTNYRPEVLDLDAADAAQKWRRSEDAFILLRWFRQFMLTRQLRGYASSVPSDVGADLLHLAKIKAQKNKLSEPLRRGFQLTQAVVDSIRRRADFATALSTFSAAGHPEKIALTGDHLKGLLDHLAEENSMASALLTTARAYQKAYEGAAAGAIKWEISKGSSPVEGRELSFEILAAQAAGVLTHERDIRPFSLFARARGEADDHGLAYFTRSDDAALSGGPEETLLRFELGLRRAVAHWAISENRILRDFSGMVTEDLIVRFRELDAEHLKMSTEEVRARLRERQGAVYRAEFRTALGILNQELQKKRKQMPVRQLIKKLGPLLTELTPCLLMSPLSVAQYLPAEAGSARFDVVVFDEASQIPTWDAIGAIARGQQVVVVGDSKQLPPTSFFGAGGSEQEVDYTDDEATVQDLESILDEMKAAQLRSWSLRWHYRSRAESLIAFSNRQYYGSDLNTFPAPVKSDHAVCWHKVKSREYEKGRNKKEARKLVAYLTGRLREVGPREMTFGVVTFGKAQQGLIEDLLEEARRENPAIERHFNTVLDEGVFVKNIENVQGDERDVILFSITYGPDAAGKVAMRFGPMNQLGGERRLNVAVTRARRQMHLFSSMEPEDIDPRRLGENAQGARDLRYFLEFAKHGPVAFAKRITAIGGSTDYDSPFEEAVAGALRARGFETDTQVGVSGYRIDLGVRDPRQPGHYLAGVECDGASYHSTATARERDLLRQGVLEGLGWRILRVWSLDWWHDAERTADKLAVQLTQLVKASMPGGSGTAIRALADRDPPPDVQTSSLVSTEVITSSTASETVPTYYNYTGAERLSGLREAAANKCEGCSASEAFYDDRALRPLIKMVERILDQEAPILRDVLLSRVAAEGFGFSRAGSKISRRLKRVIPIAGQVVEEHGEPVVWRNEQQRDRGLSALRQPNPMDDYARAVKELPLLELKVSAREHIKKGLDGDDLIRAIGKDVGLSSVRGSSRRRVERAVELAWEG